MIRRSTPVLPRLPLSIIAVLLVGVACSGGTVPETDTISRQTFVDAYVELRAAAIAAGTPSPDARTRADILSRVGVTDVELIHFAQVRGSNVDYMRAVWADVEERLAALPVPTGSSLDAVGGREAPLGREARDGPREPPGDRGR